ncbi:MAG: hypothetical protein ACI4P1_03075 [Erysipelotrichaceae bacterium]
MSILNDAEEGTGVSFVLDEENSMLVITLKNGSKTETIEKSVKIEYPLWKLKDDSIRIDTYKGYNINELLTLKDSVEIISDELNGNVLTVKLSDGEKEETVNIEVELYSSLMKFNVVGKDVCGIDPIPDYTYAWIELYEDGTFFEKSYDTGYECAGTWDENGTYANCGGDSIYNFTNIADDWSYIEGTDKAYCGNGLSSTVELVRQD